MCRLEPIKQNVDFIKEHLKRAKIDNTHSIDSTRQLSNPYTEKKKQHKLRKQDTLVKVCFGNHLIFNKPIYCRPQGFKTKDLGIYLMAT